VKDFSFLNKSTGISIELEFQILGLFDGGTGHALFKLLAQVFGHNSCSSI
jgi:hypothetical protein